MSQKPKLARKKMWGGRFKKPTNPMVEEFTSSLQVDMVLAPFDITASMAHARMLGKCGIIAKAEADRIVKGLEKVAFEIMEEEKLSLDNSVEDVHTLIENRLTELIGPVAGKLHTARSRNDQVATAMRLYLMFQIGAIHQDLINKLQAALIDLAEQNADVILPGYTHLQHAQPVLLAHHLLAYVEMLGRDNERFTDVYYRASVLPLGSAALAGTSLPIDREFVAEELGFEQVAENSLDAVSDRDFVLEFLSANAVMMMHLSRLAEEIILWNTSEFGFIELPDEFTTGSSLMPQKKNPDVAELIRGRCGRVYGHLMNLLTTMKALPLAYNRDMQEDKYPLFDTADVVTGCLNILIGLLPQLKINRERMRTAASTGFMLATDLAEYLAGKGLPFRQAHEVVGNLVIHCLDQDKDFPQLSLSEFQQYSPLFAEDVFERLSLEKSVESRTSQGGASSRQVKEALLKWKKRLAEAKEEAEADET